MNSRHDKSYWDSLNNDQVSDKEDVRANPDLLDESETPWLPRFSEKQREKLGAIQESFGVLTDVERRIITLIYTENLTQTEIGQRLKISQQLVSKYLNDARKKIKKIFSESSSKEGSQDY